MSKIVNEELERVVKLIKKHGETSGSEFVKEICSNILRDIETELGVEIE